jgi:hypothetical protein
MELEKQRQDGEEPTESVKKEEEVKIDGRTKAARKKQSLNGGNANKKRKVQTCFIYSSCVLIQNRCRPLFLFLDHLHLQ